MSGADAASTEPLEALEVIAALRKFGWLRESQSPGEFEAWVSDEDRPESSVLIPLDPGKGDYKHLLSRAREALIDNIGGDALRFMEALHQVSAAALDVTRFGKETAVAAGAISWRQGEALIHSAQASLAAAAKASREQRRYYGPSSAYIARSFLDATLMGQTEVGSFVVKAYTPSRERFYFSASPSKHVGQMPELAARSGRQIIETLAHSVSTTREVLDEYARVRRVELFAEAVVDGISYELVKALAEFARDSERAMVLINYASRPHDTTPEVEVGFSAPDAPVLDSAAVHLAAERPPADVRLRGKVRMLRGPGIGEAGLISLDIINSFKPMKVRVRLSPEDFERAFNAYGEGAVMVVTGRLEREGNLHWLYDATDIEFERPTVEQDAEDEDSDRQMDLDFEEHTDRSP